MKRLHYLSLFIVALFATSCSYNELPEELRVEPIFEDKITLNVETRAETYEGKALDQEYFVTAQDLENFVKFRRDASKRPDLSVKEVVSYGFDSSQTLFYILNYNEGWEVISADKRTQPTLAHGDEGSFTMDTDNEAMKFWMNRTANGVLVQRQTSEDETTTRSETADDPEDVNEYVQFWNDISPTTQNTRGGIEIPTWGPLNPIDTTVTIGVAKKYYLNHIMDSYSESDEYGPYIETDWGQENPWNECCPKINDTTCVAGCAPISHSQMLYYIVNRYSLDILVYEDIVSTIENGVYHFDKINPSTSWWDMMATNSADTIVHSTRYSAALITHVGDLLNTEYGITSSSTTSRVGKQLVFAYYNIDCTYSTGYSPSVVKSQIRDRHMPIIVRGENSEGGHSWIIDGCCDSQIVIKKYYIYSYRELTDAELLTYTREDADGFDTATYSSLGEIHMNWGWDGTSDGWYSDVYSAPTNDPYDPYDEDVEMMYGFIPN